MRGYDWLLEIARDQERLQDYKRLWESICDYQRLLESMRTTYESPSVTTRDY